MAAYALLFIPLDRMKIVIRDRYQQQWPAVAFRLPASRLLVTLTSTSPRPSTVARPSTEVRSDGILTTPLVSTYKKKKGGCRPPLMAIRVDQVLGRRFRAPSVNKLRPSNANVAGSGTPETDSTTATKSLKSRSLP